MRLPIFKAFGATIGLVTARFGTLVQIAWLPMLAMSAVSAWFLWNLLPALSGLLQLSEHSRPEDVAAAVGPLFLPVLLVFAVALVFMPMLFAGLLRYIVRGERPPGPFYLHFGGDELRTLGTYAGIVLINLGIAMVLAMIGGLVVPMVGGKGSPAGALGGSLIELAARLVELFIAVRLSLAFPAAIGARAIGIGLSWQLSRGNFWRLLGYWALWYAALVLVAAVIALPFLAPLGDLLREFEGVAGNEAAAKELMAAKIGAISDWVAANGTAVWLAIGVHYAVSLIITIVQVTAAGVAYRLIKAEGADAAA